MLYLMNSYCQGILLFLLFFDKCKAINGTEDRNAEANINSANTDSNSSAKKKSDDQKWFKKLKDYKPSSTDSAVAKNENKDGANDAVQSKAQSNPKRGPDLWNTVNQGASCIQWGECRNMHSSWHRNQRRTYGKRVKNVIGMGELFCIRLWPCEEKRAEFCMFHALDGNVTIYKLCRIWFDPDY